MLVLKVYCRHNIAIFVNSLDSLLWKIGYLCGRSCDSIKIVSFVYQVHYTILGVKLFGMNLLNNVASELV